MIKINDLNGTVIQSDEFCDKIFRCINTLDIMGYDFVTIFPNQGLLFKRK